MTAYPMRLGASAFASVMLFASPAAAKDRKVEVQPYIEVDQVLTADLQSGDVLTFTNVAAGVDASISTRRVSLNISARYDRTIAWKKNSGDSDQVSGLANVSVAVARGLSLDGGGLATRTRGNLEGAAPLLFRGDNRDTSDVYSVYGGPTLSTTSGPFEIGAAYRYAYTKVTAPDGGFDDLDAFDDSRTQVASGSIATKSGTLLPIGLTLMGGWERDDAGVLKQRYVDRYGQVDAVLPVSGTFAVTGSVGYEKLTVSSKAPVLDSAGDPVVDNKGRIVTDESQPRRIDYKTDGVFWDAGVIWRPSPRTTLQAQVGKRYNDTIYTGSLSYAPAKNLGVQIGIYDEVDTFGRQLGRNIRTLPTSFTSTRDLISQQFAGCTFGTTGGQANGACLNNVFDSITNAVYRSRGVDAVVYAVRGRTSLGFGAGYQSRKFETRNIPGYLVQGTGDDSYYAQFFFQRALTSNSGVSGDLFANYFEGDFQPSLFSAGATASYYRNWGRLGATASLGLFYFDQNDTGLDEVTAQGLVGLRYSF